MIRARPACALLLTLVALASSRADEPPPPRLPDELPGFAGELVGTVKQRWENAFLLEVAEVASVWKHSTAARPEAAVGETLLVNLRWEQAEGRWRPAPLQVRWLAGVREGQRVRVDLRNDEGQRLHLMELNAEQRRAVAGAGEGGRREGAEGGEPPRREGGEPPRREGGEPPRREGGQGAGRLPAPPVPEGFRGFSGRVAGFAVRRGEGELLFLVVRVLETWKASSASAPEQVLWRALRVEARREGERPAERQLRWIRTVVPGEDYQLELREEGGRVFILELNERQRQAADAAR